MTDVTLEMKKKCQATKRRKTSRNLSSLSTSSGKYLFSYFSFKMRLKKAWLAHVRLFWGLVLLVFSFLVFGVFCCLVFVFFFDSLQVLVLFVQFSYIILELLSNSCSSAAFPWF